MIKETRSTNIGKVILALILTAGVCYSYLSVTNAESDLPYIYNNNQFKYVETVTLGDTEVVVSKQHRLDSTELLVTLPSRVKEPTDYLRNKLKEYLVSYTNAQRPVKIDSETHVYTVLTVLDHKGNKFEQYILPNSEAKIEDIVTIFSGKAPTYMHPSIIKDKPVAQVETVDSIYPEEMIEQE